MKHTTLKAKNARDGYLLIAPLLLGMLVFYAVPFFLVVRKSVYHGVGNSERFVGLDNFRGIPGNAVFQLAFGNTLKFLLVSLPLILILSFAIALLLRSQAQKHETLMLENLARQLRREPLAERIAYRRKMRYFIQQSISQKPAVGQIDKDLPVCLPQGRYPEQMLDQHHLNENHRINPRPPIVMAIVCLQSFIQPFIVHDLIHFSQQMIFRNQRFYICYHGFFPCVPSPLLHTEHLPLLLLPFYQMWRCLNSFLTR